MYYKGATYAGQWYSVTIYIVDDLPVLELSRDVMVGDEFRASCNAWLLERFPRVIQPLADGEVRYFEGRRPNEVAYERTGDFITKYAFGDLGAPPCFCINRRTVDRLSQLTREAEDRWAYVPGWGFGHSAPVGVAIELAAMTRLSGR